MKTDLSEAKKNNLKIPVFLIGVDLVNTLVPRMDETL